MVFSDQKARSARGRSFDFISVFYDILLIQRVLLAKRRDLCANLICRILVILSGERQEMSESSHVVLLESSGGNCGSSYSDTRGNEGLLGIVGDSVLVCGDVNAVKSCLEFLARNV